MHFTNGIIGFLNNNNVNIGKLDEPDVKDMWQIMDERCKSLQLESREKLNSLLRALLAERVNMSPDAPLDMISEAIIKEASYLFDISGNLTAAQRADAVFNRYSERVMKNIQKSLQRQNLAQACDTSAKLQTQIDNLTESQKQDMKTLLNVDKLTGDTLRGALLKAGAPAAMLAVVSTTGMGAYLALTTIIHAVCTTALGITLPFAAYTGASYALSFILGPAGFIAVTGIAVAQVFIGGQKFTREVMAQAVWAAVSAYGSKFAQEEQ